MIKNERLTMPNTGNEIDDYRKEKGKDLSSIFMVNLENT